MPAVKWNSVWAPCWVAGLSWLLTACSSGGSTPSNETVSSLFSFDAVDVPALQTALQKQWADSVWLQQQSPDTKALPLVYAQRGFKPFWLTKDGVHPCASRWLQALQSLRNDAMAVDSLEVHMLDSLLQEAGKKDVLENMAFLTTLETRFSQSYARTARRLIIGNGDSLGVPKKFWHPSNDSANVPLWFAQGAWSDSSSMLQGFRPQHPWYIRLCNEYHRVDSLAKHMAIPQPSKWFSTDSNGVRIPTSSLYALLDARMQGIPDSFRATDSATFKKLVARFQFQYGIKATGKLDSVTERLLQWPWEEQKKSLALNLERFRRFSNVYQQPFVWVNIPQMNLMVFANDTPVFYMRTVVGRPSRPTPVIDATMKHVVVSPPWTVPPTILEKDVLPGVLRRGGGYLARKGLKAVDGNGRPVNPSSITLANYKRFSYTQKPGYNSSLGEVKFNMPNSESVYMHDTPHREDFPKANRALSSGCVRVHKPKEFATFVLNDSVKYSYTKIDSMCKERKTKYIPVAKPMRVYFAYLTAGVDSTGRMMYPADIYQWDPYRP